MALAVYVMGLREEEQERESGKEVFAAEQVSDAGGLDAEVGFRGGADLEVEPREFADGLDVQTEGKGKLRISRQI